MMRCPSWLQMGACTHVATVRVIPVASVNTLLSQGRSMKDVVKSTCPPSGDTRSPDREYRAKRRDDLVGAQSGVQFH